MNMWMTQLIQGPNHRWPTGAVRVPSHHSQNMEMWWYTWRKVTWFIFFRSTISVCVLEIKGARVLSYVWAQR